MYATIVLFHRTHSISSIHVVLLEPEPRRSCRTTKAAGPEARIRSGRDTVDAAVRTECVAVYVYVHGTIQG